VAHGRNDSTDFEALAQRYWGAWGDAMRNAVPGSAPSPGVAGTQAWHEAIDWWTRAAHGQRGDVNDTVDRFNTQARGWFAQMQQVAAQFAGRESSAAEVARAWKQALGAAGENPFPEMFRSMHGQGLQGLDQWVEDARPYLGAWQQEASGWLRMPQFGFAREHQERAQRLVEAQLEYQQQSSAFNALMLKASQSAYELFESKLAEREEPGRQIDSPRALFDLWIDAAEEAYAEIALSAEFRETYGALVNAQMRLRGAVQREVEQVSALFGMPTRSELDGAHRKIVELERAVRRLRDAARPPHPPEAPRKSAAATAAHAATGTTAKPGAKKKAQGKPARARPAASSTAMAVPAKGARASAPADKATRAGAAKGGAAPAKGASRKPRTSKGAR
jgi:polyhydroxyalkanoate synthase subunit PhaE